MKRLLSVNQGKKPQEKPTLSTLWFGTSSLQKCEGIKFCWFSHLVCVTLLWQPLQTNTTQIGVLVGWKVPFMLMNEHDSQEKVLIASHLYLPPLWIFSYICQFPSFCYCRELELCKQILFLLKLQVLLTNTSTLHCLID